MINMISMININVMIDIKEIEKIKNKDQEKDSDPNKEIKKNKKIEKLINIEEDLDRKAETKEEKIDVETHRNYFIYFFRKFRFDSPPKSHASDMSNDP